MYAVESLLDTLKKFQDGVLCVDKMLWDGFARWNACISNFPHCKYAILVHLSLKLQLSYI